MGGKYCLRKTIWGLQVIYFLIVFCVNLVLPLLLCVISPTHLSQLDASCLDFKDKEGPLWNPIDWDASRMPGISLNNLGQQWGLFNFFNPDCNCLIMPKARYRLHWIAYAYCPSIWGLMNFFNGDCNCLIMTKLVLIAQARCGLHWPL